MKSILILTMVILAGCAAPKPGKIADALTDEQKVKCQADGGCLVVSRLTIYALMMEAVQEMCGKGDSL